MVQYKAIFDATEYQTILEGIFNMQEALQKVVVQSEDLTHAVQLDVSLFALFRVLL